jgi:hypothetical protein
MLHRPGGDVEPASTAMDSLGKRIASPPGLGLDWIMGDCDSLSTVPRIPMASDGGRRPTCAHRSASACRQLVVYEIGQSGRRMMTWDAAGSWWVAASCPIVNSDPRLHSIIRFASRCSSPLRFRFLRATFYVIDSNRLSFKI